MKTNSKRVIWVTLGLVILAGMPGCIKGRYDLKLNPDGSGRMLIDVKCAYNQGVGLSSEANEKGLSLEMRLYRFIQGTIESSEGVEGWEQVSAKFLRDGRVHFKGVAYFKDINKVDIQHVPLHFELNKKSDRELYFKMMIDLSRQDQLRKPEKDVDYASMDEEALLTLIIEQRIEYQNMKKMYSAILKDLEVEISVQLPVAENGDQPTPPARYRFNGNRVLASLDEFSTMDEQTMIRQLKKGVAISEMFKALNKDIGLSANEVVFEKGMKNQFDYGREAERAAEGTKQMLENIKRRLSGNEKPDKVSG